MKRRSCAKYVLSPHFPRTRAGGLRYGSKRHVVTILFAGVESALAFAAEALLVPIPGLGEMAPGASRRSRPARIGVGVPAWSGRHRRRDRGLFDDALGDGTATAEWLRHRYSPCFLGNFISKSLVLVDNSRAMRTMLFRFSHG